MSKATVDFVESARRKKPELITVDTAVLERSLTKLNESIIDCLNAGMLIYVKPDDIMYAGTIIILQGVTFADGKLVLKKE